MKYTQNIRVCLGVAGLSFWNDIQSIHQTQPPRLRVIEDENLVEDWLRLQGIEK